MCNTRKTKHSNNIQEGRGGTAVLAGQRTTKDVVETTDHQPFDYATDGPAVDCLKSNNVHNASVEAQAADPRQGGFALLFPY